MNSQAVARKLIRTARDNGAFSFEVLSEGDVLNETQREDDIVEALHACDEVTLVIRNEEGKSLTRILFIPSNGNDAISDWTCTTWADSVLDPLLDEIA